MPEDIAGEPWPKVFLKELRLSLRKMGREFPPPLPKNIRTGDIIEAIEACNALPEKHLQIIKKVIIQLFEDYAEARRSPSG
jgi:hypothetical protein